MRTGTVVWQRMLLVLCPCLLERTILCSTWKLLTSTCARLPKGFQVHLRELVALRHGSAVMGSSCPHLPRSNPQPVTGRSQRINPPVPLLLSGMPGVCSLDLQRVLREPHLPTAMGGSVPPSFRAPFSSFIALPSVSRLVHPGVTPHANCFHVGPCLRDSSWGI